MVDPTRATKNRSVLGKKILTRTHHGSDSQPDAITTQPSDQSQQFFVKIQVGILYKSEFTTTQKSSRVVQFNLRVRVLNFSGIILRIRIYWILLSILFQS